MDFLLQGENGGGVSLGVCIHRSYIMPYVSGVVRVDGGLILIPLLQTSIMAVEFNGGVVMGADSRTTTGTRVMIIN